MTLPRRAFVKFGIVLGGLGAGSTARVGRPAPVEPTLEPLWNDLEEGTAEASRALLKLSDRPAEAVAFLKAKLRPLKVDADLIRTLLQLLGSADEAEWQTAFEELEYFDPRLAIDLETLMNDVKDNPARNRMVEVLSGREAGSLAGKVIELKRFGHEEGKLYYNFFAQNHGSWWAEGRVSELNSHEWGDSKKKWTRAVRALILLEHIATPDAVAILRAMADGDPDAQPTRQAKESLAKVAGAAR